jgi:hypothetical protein
LKDYYTPAQRAAYNKAYREKKPKDIPWSQFPRPRLKNSTAVPVNAVPSFEERR